MPRPSPRTQGIDEEGLPFQKFGTQQLVKDPLSPTGVKEINVGQQWKGFTTSGYTGTKTTVFSERFQAGITGAVPVELHDEAVRRQKEKLEEMGIPQLPDIFGDLFKPKDTGCECQACKDGTGKCSDKRAECNEWDIGCEIFGNGNGNGNGNGKCTKCDSDKCKECNAWDVGCELGHMFAGTCTPPEKPPDEECDLGCLMTFRGCDCGCKDVKPCTTCDSTVCKECNAWDLQCEDCKKKDGTCTPPRSEECGCLPYDFGCEIGCWWEKNKNYVYLIGGLIGLGVLLWLLRPLFGMIGAFKGGSP